MSTKSSQRCLAVCKRCQVLVLAVVESDDILEVRRHFPWNQSGQDYRSAIRKAVVSIMADYNIRTIVVEPDSLIHECIQDISVIQRIELSTAKQLLIPPRENKTHSELCTYLVNSFPKLGRLVTVLPYNRIAMTERWRTVALLAVALGLAVQKIIIRH